MPDRTAVATTQGVRQAIALAAIAISLVACGSSTTTTSTTIQIPSGWKSETYGKLAIAVPGTWVVEHGTNCPDVRAPGTLFLGLPKVFSSCPAIPSTIAFVTVSQITSETSTTNIIPAGQKAMTINGIPVYAGFGSSTTLNWIVPSLGVQIVGVGPESSKIVHTIHES